MKIKNQLFNTKKYPYCFAWQDWRDWFRLSSLVVQNGRG